MEKVKDKRKIFILVSLLLLLVSMLTPSFLTSYATSPVHPPGEEGTQSVVKLDHTRVMDDLLSADGFNVLNYPFDQTEDKMVVINFIEYCYSYKLDSQDNYALYIYVYNPQGIEIDTLKTNKVQMAVEFDEERNPTRYEKFDLEFCDKSQGDYAELFYKFKIKNAEYFLDVVNSLERYYYISGIELQVNGLENATEYNVSTLYTYKGYALGFGGNNDESTLTCTADMIETITLDVNHTYYRTGEASEYWESNQINSVYFAVPNEVLDRYGNLYAIHAEWYEYMTQPIFVTASSELYNEISPYIGINLDNENDKPKFGLAYGTHSNNMGGTSILLGADFGYNIEQFVSSGIAGIYDRINTIYYLFSSSGTTGKYIINSEILAEYIYNYNKSYVSGTIDVNNRNISADLFATEDKFNATYQGERVMGYNNVNITAEDSIKVETITQNSWWDRLWGNDKTITAQNIAPITIIEDDILSMSDSEAITKYLVAENDVSEIKEYYREQTLEDKTVFLFRFANTKYNSIALNVLYADYNFLQGPVIKNDKNSHPTVMATQNVFFDFDIIDLTLTNEGIFYVIPVVSSPIDIVPDVEVDIPEQNNNWWVWLLLAIGVIVLLIALPALMPVLTFLFQAVIWVICLPFRLIGWIFNLIFKKRRNE